MSIARRLACCNAWLHQLLSLQVAIAKSTNRTPASWQARARHCGPSWRLSLDGSAPWHDILQEWNARVWEEWNARVWECAEQDGVKLWSRRCLEQRWILANYIANLSDSGWLNPAQVWTSGCRTGIGRPTNT